jgi:myo-inositol-1(or 4)-monophosphatase
MASLPREEKRMDLKQILLDTKEIAEKAGSYIIARMNNIKNLDYKEGDFSNLVTDVDKASEKMIVEYFNTKYPEFSVLSEEGMNKSSQNSSFKLIIDPIDGTTNFVHGFPFFCVSIGLEFEGRIVLGIIYDPSSKEMFSAIENEGSFLNDKKIVVSKNDSLSKSLIATGFQNDLCDNPKIWAILFEMTKKASSLRRTGSSALNLCHIACGRFDGYWERGLSPWDSAGGCLILKEAGGKITDYTSDTYSIYQKDILATNGLVHDEIQNIIRREMNE